MQLLCVGDIAILDEYVTRQTWDIPKPIVDKTQTKILFNLEYLVGNSVKAEPRVIGPRYIANPHALSTLRKWSPGYAALANNHTLDAGNDGLILTIQKLTNMGFSTIGAGKTEEEIKRPIFWETSEGRLAIVNWVFPETHPECGCVPGPNCWPGYDEAEQIIRDLKHQADWVLVRVHWSDEFFAYPRPADRALARELARMGADVVIGDHPHVVRGIEVINSCTVYYSIGCYYSSHEPTSTGGWDLRAPKNHIGLGVLISCHQGGQLECQPLSFLRLRKRVVFDKTNRAVRTLKRVSQPLRQFQDNEYVDWYNKKRAFFNKWGYRLQFGLWNLSIKDIKRILAKPWLVFFPNPTE